jgi:hypothetical protein
MLCDIQTSCKNVQDTRYCYSKCHNYYYEQVMEATDNFEMTEEDDE